jgi:transposase-like protein
MTIRISRDPIYRRRRFSAETIELCVRWYITYRLSYRDLVAMMAEREIAVSHTTIMRWVLKYVPEYERRWARFARPPGLSWRMDETAVSVRGGWHYLYRAADRDGKSVASLLCRNRCMRSMQAFFRSAVSENGVPWPGKINLDGNKATHLGLQLLGKEDCRWRGVEIRARRYLNNVLEQDHRAIKRRCASMLGLKSFRSAAITLTGIEFAHRIRKGQYLLEFEHYGRASSLKELWGRVLSPASKPLSENIGGSPSTHQNSKVRRSVAKNKPTSRRGVVRYPRKLSFGRNLYMLVMPKGGRYWRYCYRYGGKRKTLALGTYPDVPISRARSRHRAARQLLAAGVDPSLKRSELRRLG